MKFGARPVSTNKLPEVRISWEEKKDDKGIQIKTHRRHYRTIESFLRQAFGEPHMPPAAVKGGIMSVYAAKDIGVAIQMGTDEKGTFVVLIRGMSWNEVRGGAE